MLYQHVEILLHRAHTCCRFDWLKAHKTSITLVRKLQKTDLKYACRECSTQYYGESVLHINQKKNTRGCMSRMNITFFRLLPLVSGTICHSKSRLQNLCLSSAVASRLISLGAAFRDTLTFVVPKK